MMAPISERLKSTSAVLEPFSIAGSTKTERSSEEKLQDTFSEVLLRVNREGYQSAMPLEANTNLEQQVIENWENWFDSIAPSRYSFEFRRENPSVQKGSSQESLKHDFGQILSDAHGQGGYADPLAYLKTLTTDQLATIQQVQHLADPIDLERLTEESSLNLLLPPDAQVDSNHDGLTAIGAAYSIRFPDSNTPSQVRRAWDRVTENLSESDRLTYELQMVLPVILANIHTDSDGNYIGSSHPGDADWVNPMSQMDYSYTNVANDRLAYLEHFRSQIAPSRYEREHRFWSSFRAALAFEE